MLIQWRMVKTYSNLDNDLCDNIISGKMIDVIIK